MEVAPEVPSFEIAEIARTIRTNETGTLLGNVRKINVALEKAIPSVEFSVDFKSHQFREIEKELANSRPVIAWLFVKEGNRRYEHTLVVRGYDKEKQLVAVNDSLRGNGPSEVPISKFMEEWEGAGGTLIKLRVGARVQRKLTEYIEKASIKERS